MQEEKESNDRDMIDMFFGAPETVVEEPPVEEVKEPIIEEQPIEEAPKEEPVVEVKEEPKNIWVPEFKSDTDKALYEKLANGEQKEVYQMLKNQFLHEELDDEQKIMTYLAEKNPYLSKEDLAFKAATDYGIGSTDIDEDDLTPDQISEIKLSQRKQELERKGLLNEADKYFKEQARNIELPKLTDPRDADEEYQNYKKFVQDQSERQAEEEKVYNDLVNEINNTSIESLVIDEEIELDDNKLVINSTFKLDEAKRKQLADYTQSYTPTKEEGERFLKDGKLATKEYMTFLGQKLFADQIRKAAIKEALVKDREVFVERELKNSSLRNNETMTISTPDVDIHSYVMGLPNS